MLTHTHVKVTGNILNMNSSHIHTRTSGSFCSPPAEGHHDEPRPCRSILSIVGWGVGGCTWCVGWAGGGSNWFWTAVAGCLGLASFVVGGNLLLFRRGLLHLPVTAVGLWDNHTAENHFKSHHSQQTQRSNNVGYLQGLSCIENWRTNAFPNFTLDLSVPVH